MQLSPQPPQFRPAIVIPQDVPVYKVTNERGFFGPDDRLHPYGVIICYEDEPSVDMEPMNEKAHKMKLALLEKLDEEGRKVAEKTGKQFRSQADALKNARELAKQSPSILRLGEEEAVPLLGKRKPGRPRVEQVQPVEGPVDVVEVKRKDA